MGSRRIAFWCILTWVAGLIGLAATGTAEDSMLTAARARATATVALQDAERGDDAVFEGWPPLEVGTSHMVHDLQGDASYWVVALVLQNTPVGFVRVLADGTVAAIGLTCRTLESLRECSVPVFSMSPEAVTAHVSLAVDETYTAPLLVHDGPTGREVWRVEVRRNGRPARWVFVGPAGTYERPAGTFIATDQEME